jgi:hypothetical protein
MNRGEERWFIRTQGHTLGPIASAEVENRLLSGELLPGDKICAPTNGIWLAISDHHLFSSLCTKLKPESQLELPPSPSILWKKKRQAYAPPKAPELPKETSPAPAAAKAAPPDPVAPALVTKEPAALPDEKLAAEKLFAEKILAEKIAPAISAAEIIPAANRIPEAPSLPRKSYSQDSFPDPRAVALSLKAALRDWAAEEERSQSQRKNPAYELPPSPPPSIVRPTADSWRESSSRYYEEPAPRPAPQAQLNPQPKPPKAQKAIPEEKNDEFRVIRIELKIPGLRGFGWMRGLAWAIALGLVAAAGWLHFNGSNKTRDLKGFRLSDPSSPTTEPSTESDPIPPLKAPTRPQRE